MVKVPGLSSVLSPVLPGTYECRVNEMSLETSRNGRAMWHVRLVIAEDGPNQGRYLHDYFVIENNEGGPSAVGIRRLANFLRTVGAQVANDEFDPSEVIGNYIHVRVEHDYAENGDTYERIRQYIRA